MTVFPELHLRQRQGRRETTSLQRRVSGTIATSLPKSALVCSGERRKACHHAQQLWIFPWIRGSVADGASRVKGRSRREETLISNDARALTEPELRKLADPATALGSQRRALYHDSSAFFAIMALKANLEVGSWNGEEQMTLTQKKGKLEFSSSKSKPAQPWANWIRVRRQNCKDRRILHSPLAALIQPSSLWRSVQSALRSSTCRFAPTPILWNNYPLNDPLIASTTRLKKNKITFSAGGELGGGVYFLSDAKEDGVAPGFPVAHGRRLVWLRGDPDAPKAWENIHSTGSGRRTAFFQTPLEESSLAGLERCPDM